MAKKEPKVVKADENINLSRIFVFIGGILSIVGGLCSIFLGTTLIQIVTGWNVVSGTILPYLGFLGIIGGLFALYGMVKNENTTVILGGILGLFSPSFLSVLSIIGGLLMKVTTQKTAITKLLTYPKGKLLVK